jgi:phage tail protein X
MTNRATLKEELRVDLVAKALLGTEQNGNLEALLAANPELPAPYVTEGTELLVPDAAPPATPKTVYPWA